MLSSRKPNDIKSHIATVIIAVTLCCIFCSTTLAKTSGDLKELETKIDAQKEKEDKLKEQEKNASIELEKLQKQLVEATKALQEKQDTADELSDKLKELAKESKNKAATLDASRENLSMLLSALLQLSRDPPQIMLLQEELSADQIRRGLLLRNILPKVQTATTSLAQDISDMEQLHKATEEQRRLVASAEKNLTSQKQNLDKMVKTRKGLLQKTSAQRTAITMKLEQLAAEAQDLKQLLQKVGQASAMPKEKSFSSKPLTLKSGLRPPVAGRTVRTFGVKDSYGVLSQGITIAAPAGSPVVAPSAGKVAFAGPFKGYGQIIILAHAGGYHSFLAGFGYINAETGQDVTAGEPIGTMPEKSGTSASERPELYFEWRKHGEPVNPSG